MASTPTMKIALSVILVPTYHSAKPFFTPVSATRYKTG